jgi:hypothetical protein
VEVHIVQVSLTSKPGPNGVSCLCSLCPYARASQLALPLVESVTRHPYSVLQSTSLTRARFFTPGPRGLAKPTPCLTIDSTSSASLRYAHKSAEEINMSVPSLVSLGRNAEGTKSSGGSRKPVHELTSLFAVRDSVRHKHTPSNTNASIPSLTRLGGPPAPLRRHRGHVAETATSTR